MNKMRVGTGFDVHRLIQGRTLILGGIQIPFEKGLLGHSDADVLLHAIADALLGAAGLPDIGHFFPPDDPRYKDADSINLLDEVRSAITAAGFPKIINIDSVVMAERPKLLDHIPQMKTRISEVLEISPGQVGIKATTCEKLGFVGREEGIAASAICLIAGI